MRKDVSKAIYITNIFTGLEKKSMHKRKSTHVFFSHRLNGTGQHNTLKTLQFCSVVFFFSEF